jgi:hypothetical protein
VACAPRQTHRKNDGKAITEEQAGLYRLQTVFWKTLFWVIFYIKAQGYIAAFRVGEIEGVLDIFDLFIPILPIIGFFPYAYRRKLGLPIFWRIFALLFIGLDICLNFLIRGYQEGNWIDFLVVSPMYLALILFGFFYLRNDR